MLLSKVKSAPMKYYVNQKKQLNFSQYQTERSMPEEVFALKLPNPLEVSSKTLGLLRNSDWPVQPL